MAKSKNKIYFIFAVSVLLALLLPISSNALTRTYITRTTAFRDLQVEVKNCLNHYNVEGKLVQEFKKPTGNYFEFTCLGRDTYKFYYEQGGDIYLEFGSYFYTMGDGRGYFMWKWSNVDLTYYLYPPVYFVPQGSGGWGGGGACLVMWGGWSTVLIFLC